MEKATNNKTVCKACIEEVPVLCECIKNAARACGMDDNSIWKLEISVDEACTNIACYSYKNNSDGKIWLHWDCKDGNFILTIEDTGIAFDQTKPTNPDFETDICCRKPGGLGRFIMREFIDELCYKRENNRNILTMIKKIDSSRN